MSVDKGLGVIHQGRATPDPVDRDQDAIPWSSIMRARPPNPLPLTGSPAGQECLMVTSPGNTVVSSTPPSIPRNRIIMIKLTAPPTNRVMAEDHHAHA